MWDAMTGEKKQALTGHLGPVYSVAFSPDGKTLVSGGYLGVWLWDAITVERKQILSGHTDAVYGLAFSPDGHTLASGSYQEVWLWNTMTGKQKQALAGHTDMVHSLTFSPDGRTLASGGADKTIRLWNAMTGEHKGTLIGHTTSVESVAFSPDGNTLVSGSEDGTVLLWDPTFVATTVPPVVHVPTTVHVSPAMTPSPAVGKQLTLSLNITDGENVAAYQATIGFDTSALRYVGSTNGDYLPTEAFFVTPVVSGNSVVLAATALGGESHGDGTLATITFEVIAVKPSTVRLAEVLLSDSQGIGSQPYVEDGQIVESLQVRTDVNRDGVVNIQDLVFVAGAFGQTGPDEADINADGVVNVQDLVILAGVFGTAVAAPSLHPQALGMLTVTDVEDWLTQAHQMALTDPTYLRGIAVLEQLLAALAPKETALLPNYPNPFNPETWIPYHLAHDAEVTLTIYDTNGTMVRQLALGYQSRGYYTDRSKAVYWDGRNESGESVASGVYFYQLRAGDYIATRRMVILK